MTRYPTMLRASALIAAFTLGSTTQCVGSPVTITIDPDAGRTPISPFIYGTNQDLPGAHVTVRRFGGNRTTGYNWENNASNAGNDYLHQSDNFLTWNAGIPSEQENVPGIVLTQFHDASLAQGVPYTVLTLPMAGYVARDKSGPVSEAESAPSDRWVPVVNTKDAPFSLDPDTDDGAVYSDELLNFLIDRYGPADGTSGIRGYNLDNEPDLWSDTHARLHPAKPTCVELVSRSVDLAKTVKRIDPQAEVLGFVSYGFTGYLSFQDAPDWSTEQAKGGYRWFVDYFLDQMKEASDAAGERLLDVLDLHNYTEHVAGGERVNAPSEWSNDACNLGRMQAPRSYWDSTFTENSWIGQYFSSFLPLLPNVRQSIDTYYPGTKLAITEYNFGGESHISGGIAQADTLGIFGSSGVYLATWWQLHDDPTYIAAAFNLYRDYDGGGGEFGDTSVNASVSDLANGSVHAAIDSTHPGKLHVVVLNKSATQSLDATFTIAGTRDYTHGRVWAFDSTSPEITERTTIPEITDNTFSYSVPALTAAHFVLEAPESPPDIVVQPASVSTGTGARVVFSVLARGSDSLTYQWRKDGIDLPGENSSFLTLPAVSAADVGAYSVVVSNEGGNTTSTDAALSLDGTTYSPPSHAIVNLSTRGQVGNGDGVLIAGFHVGGVGSKRLLLRAIGPTLASPPFSVAGALSDPTIALTTPSGTLLAQDDDWGDHDNEAAIESATTATGAFAIPSGSRDSALLVELPPGGYTLIVRGGSAATGVAIVEVYDADPGSSAYLSNIATRGLVGTGDNVLIPGFVIQGTTATTLLMRAVGPTLSAPPFEIADALSDPILDLIPAGATTLASNDNWSDDPDADALAAAATLVGAFALNNPGKDATLLRTLDSGAYTLVTRGVGGSTGVALAEVYLLP